MGNTILAKGGNHILAKRDNSAWPKGSKLSGFSSIVNSATCNLEQVQYELAVCLLNVNIPFHVLTYFNLLYIVECGESNPVAVLRSSLSLIPTFRPLQPCHPYGLSRCHPRPALLTIQCSPQGLRVILQSFYLVYLRSNATSVAGHQPSYQSRHITFRC